MTKMTLRTLLIIIFVLYIALVSYLSLSPVNNASTLHIWDKAAHAIAYIGFALQCCMIASNSRQTIIMLAFCFLFGITIELLQGLTSYRFASWEDQLANTIGLLMGYFIFSLAHRYLSFKSSHR